MKKRVWSIAAILAAVVLAVVVFMFVNHDIGLPKSKLEGDLRKSQKIAEEWNTVGVASDHMAAYLSYPDNKDDHVFSIYVNRPGLSFGYFFRGGGTLSPVEQGIQEVHLEDGKEHAFLSMNQVNVARIVIEHQYGVRSVEWKAGEPFVLVLPTNGNTVTFYAADGTVVEPVEAPI